MSLEDEFQDAVAHAAAAGDPEPDLPTAVALATQKMLGVDGVGLSVESSGERFPLAGSDDDAEVAEQLQFTAGDGPCMEAMRSGSFVDAAADTLARRWPPLSMLWRAHTPFGSAASFPLLLAGDRRGALNLLFRHDRGALELDLIVAHVVAGHAGRRLSGWIAEHPQPFTALLATLPARRRAAVRIGTGLVMNESQLTRDDALSVLRAWSFSHDTTVDDVADQLVTGRLTVTELLT